MKEETKWLTGYVLSSWLSNFGQGLVVTVLGTYYALYIIHSNLVASGTYTKNLFKAYSVPSNAKVGKSLLIFWLS